MRWSSRGTSSDIEDTRGRGPSRGVMIGGGGGIVALLLALIFGPGVLNGGGGAPAPVNGPNGQEYQPSPEEQKMVEFVSFVLDDIQTTWDSEFPKQGGSYRHAKLVLFTGETQSACGAGEAAMGPFYCPADEKAYIDLSFYQVMKDRLGAPGDFAQAYVIAHELGHHVQNLRGISEKEARAMQANPGKANEISVRQELQADCLAGVWAFSANKRGVLEGGDWEEGMVAANAIGDDTLQKNAGGRVVPESFTHGTSEQRKKWFRRGFQSGSEAECDTYSANPL
ncbi:MAG: neutral zinc metallopeptidase [Myxococcota bacterium]